MQTIQNKRKSFYFLAGLIVAIALGAVWFGFFSCQKMQTVEVLGVEVRLREACSARAKLRGLGGVSREAFEADADAMIFQYKTQEERTFWMKGMQYPIDIVWVRDGKVVKIQTDVQPPQKGEDPVRMSSSPFAIDTVVEFPAGGVGKYGIMTGMIIPAFNR